MSKVSVFSSQLFSPVSQNYKTFPPPRAKIVSVMKKIFLLSTLILVFASVSLSQDFGAEAQRTEMKKLDLMVGKWEGSGWMQRGPKREEFRGGETVQKKLDGLALLVEGRFTDSENPQQVTHQTLAVLAFDTKEKGYKFKTYLLNGSGGNFDLKLVEGGWQWGFEYPGMAMRYTAKYTADTWFEIGEFSRDGGKTWVKNFEMTLKRVG